MTLSFTVPGRPVPYPRAARSGKRTYMPERYTVYKNEVATIARQAHLGKPPYAEPVSVGVYVRGAHASADVDNLAKTILDALVMAGVLVDDCWTWVPELHVRCRGLEGKGKKREAPSVLVNVTVHDER